MPDPKKECSPFDKECKIRVRRLMGWKKRRKRRGKRGEPRSAPPPPFKQQQKVKPTYGEKLGETRGPGEGGAAKWVAEREGVIIPKSGIPKHVTLNEKYKRK